MAELCHICGETFREEDADGEKDRKVKYNCHYTDKYRGGAHNICNLRYSIPKITPIIFLNGLNYDHHFMI